VRLVSSGHRAIPTFTLPYAATFSLLFPDKVLSGIQPFVVRRATHACRIGAGCIDLGACRMGIGMVVDQSAGKVIELDRVSLGWRDRIAVRSVSGGFERGCMTAIVGPNGAGKSTLIKGLMGQISPLRGTIRLSEQARRHMACLPQLGELDRSFPISVYDLVAMGAWHRIGAGKGLDEAEHARVAAALESVGLADFGARVIGTLSGGQLQRALFARLMVHDAQVILLDEPFAAVDRATTDDLMRLLHLWHSQGRSLIVVLHDLDMVREQFGQALLMAGQAVAWGPTEEVLTPENLHMARHLCAGDYL
jgi:zinc/manganese transport system ATP-binding protein